MSDLQETSLPHGWECKFDGISGRYYFLNHSTKTTTWEDPRLRHRHPQNTPKHLSNGEHIQMQIHHGSPDLKRNYVYPSQTSPVRAFHSPKSLNPLQEIRNTSRMSPRLGRTAKVQDSSFTTIPTETDDAVSKITAMFPTVSETHVRMLMKKYHNREALVISALQVEKNPITTPGPFVTPPPQRNIHHPSVYALHMTPPLGLRISSRGGSPVLKPASGANSTGSPAAAFRSSPRPHSSPKLKLRYMKSIFPQAEETVILDILYNNDNNIMKSSEVLKEMGFNRKEPVKVPPQKVEVKTEADSKAETTQETPATIKVRSPAEKIEIKNKLKNIYKDVADHLLSIALESVDFDEKRASQILDIMVQEDTEKEEENRQTKELEEQAETVNELEVMSNNLPISQSRQSIKSLLKSEKEKVPLKSHFKRILGHNPDLALGPNDKYLLSDYIDWQGPNKSLRSGPQNLQKGPNKALLSNRLYRVCGSNPELRRGPKYGLAKGNILSQLKGIMVSESGAN